MIKTNAIKAILALGVAGGGYHYYQERSAPEVARPAVSESGFVTVPPIDGQSPGAVVVVAAQNCPHEDAQRADGLAQALSDKGIPVVRTHELSARVENVDGEEAQHLTAVMNGPLPAVFVNGKAKSNPSLAEVMAEVNQRSRE